MKVCRNCEPFNRSLKWAKCRNTSKTNNFLNQNYPKLLIVVEQFSSWHISSQFCAITLQSVTARLIESSKRAFFCQRRQIAGSACGSRMHFVILSQILKNIQNSRGKTRTIQGETVPRLFENEQSSSMPWSSYSSYFLPIQCPAPRVPSRRLFRGRVLLSSPGFHQIDPMVSLFRFSSTFSSWWGSRWQTPVWVLNIILLW